MAAWASYQTTKIWDGAVGFLDSALDARHR